MNYDLVEVWRWIFAIRRHFSNLLPFPTIPSTLIHTSLSLSFLLSPVSLSAHVWIKEDASKYHERRSEFVIIAAVCFVSRTEDLDCRSRTYDQGMLPWGRKWDRFTETMTILNLRCCLLAADGLFILRQVSDGLRELRCCSIGAVPCVLKTRFTTCWLSQASSSSSLLATYLLHTYIAWMSTWIQTPRKFLECWMGNVWTSSEVETHRIIEKKLGRRLRHTQLMSILHLKITNRETSSHALTRPTGTNLWVSDDATWHPQRPPHATSDQLKLSKIPQITWRRGRCEKDMVWIL